jgi:hypothetical protein
MTKNDQTPTDVPTRRAMLFGPWFFFGLWILIFGISALS